MSVIPAPGRLRKEGLCPQFKANLGYIARDTTKEKKIN
jgi:hypothetical protein